MGLVRLVTHTDPGEHLAALAHDGSNHEASKIAAVHLSSFGGAATTAAWMNGVLGARR